MTIINAVVEIDAPAGSSGTVEVYRVPPAQVFEVRRALFIFPADTGGALGLALKVGIKQICPDKGLARGDNTSYSLFDDTALGGDEVLEVYYQNDDPANALKAWVIIEGEIKRG